MIGLEDIFDILDPKLQAVIIAGNSLGVHLENYRGPTKPYKSLIQDFICMNEDQYLVIEYWNEAHGRLDFELELCDREGLKGIAQQMEKASGTIDGFDAAVINQDGEIFKLQTKKSVTIEDIILEETLG